MDRKTVAASIAVDKIIDDLSDRKGLRHEWEQIDEDIQEEIKDQWRLIVLNAMADL